MSKSSLSASFHPGRPESGAETPLPDDPVEPAVPPSGVEAGDGDLEAHAEFGAAAKADEFGRASEEFDDDPGGRAVAAVALSLARAGAEGSRFAAVKGACEAEGVGDAEGFRIGLGEEVGAVKEELLADVDGAEVDSIGIESSRRESVGDSCARAPRFIEAIQIPPPVAPRTTTASRRCLSTRGFENFRI